MTLTIAKEGPSMSGGTIIDLLRQLPGKEQEGVAERGARKALKYAQSLSPAAQFYLGSDKEIGDRVWHQLITAFPNGVINCGGTIWAYSPVLGVWKPLEEQDILDLILSLDGRPTLVPTKKQNEFIERPERFTFNRAKSVMACMLAVSVVRHGLSEHHIRDDRYFDSPPPGVACANGFAKVFPEGVELVDHHPNHRARTWVNWSYDPGADNDGWVTLLDDVFEGDTDGPQKRQAMQQFIGACISGIATDYARSFVFLGGGSNGKSIVSEILSLLVPADMRCAVAPQKWGHEYYVADLEGKLLNVVGELPEASIMDSSAFKAVVGGDVTSARFPHGRVFRFHPIAGHLFSANNLPAAIDSSHGFWRRFVIIEFNKRFTPDDPNYMGRKELLECVLEQGSGVFTWALNGACVLMRNEEYTLPASHTEAIGAWRQESDSVADFAHNACDGTGWTATSSLYRDYRDWSEATGRRPVNKNTFGKRLTQHGFGDERRAAGRGRGLTVKPRGDWA